MVAVALYGGSFTYREIGNRRADAAAEDLAARVKERLASIARADANAMFADVSIGAWEGRPTSPFRVDGTDPELIVEVTAGLVVRYRMSRLSAQRCVDAIWPEDGPLRVRVDRGCAGHDA